MLRALHPFVPVRRAARQHVRLPQGLRTSRRSPATVRPFESVAAENLEGRLLLSSAVLFTAGFEGTSVIAGWRDYDHDGGSIIQAASAPTSPVRAGQGSARFTLPAHTQRVEVALAADPPHAERWYAFSTYVPANWTADPYRDIVAQWHEMPDRDLGEIWRIPPLSLALVNGNWQIADRWDCRPVNNGNWVSTPPFGGKKEWYFPYRKGAWTDWVFHIKWSYGSDGLTDVWENGTKVISRAGPNTYNDESGNYFKLGLYHPDYQIDAHPVTALKTIYQDEVRVGGPNATYAEMAPGRKPDPPIPSVVVNGTAGRDTIRVTQAGTTLTVNLNGRVSTLSTAGASRLVVNGGDGEDAILLDKSVTIDSVLNGGGGRDRLRGGSGADEFYGGDSSDTVDYSDQTVGVSVSLDDEWNDGPVSGKRDNVRVDVENVIGGAGNDTLVGSYFPNLLVGNGGDDVLRDNGGGCDVLIGGAGKDQLFGNGGQDLLIGGRTVYDGNYSSLIMLQSVWQRDTTLFATRVAQLQAGTGGVRIAATTVVNDAAADVLTGGTGKDWWVCHPLDTVPDRTATDVLTEL